MSLDEHYLLSEPLPPRMGNADQTIAAEEVVSGVSVIIHLLAGGNCPANQEQLNVARSLPPANVRYLREIGEHRGTPYVVTEPLPGNASFRSWLGQVAGRPMPVPEFKTLVASEPDVSRFKKQVWKVPAVPQVLDQAKPGEFTQMFKTVEPLPSPVPPPPPPPSAPPAPGEFTAMFQAQPVSKPQPVPPAAPIPSSPEQPSPGEFTRLMQAQNPAKPQPPSAPPVTPAAPPPSAGEFTQMFQAASMGTGIRPAPPPPPPPAPPAPPASDYDKTRLFTAPTPPPLDFGAEPTASPRPARSDSPLTSAEPGEFTRMLQSPLAPAPQAPLFSAAEPISEKTPGGFTQLFESPFATPKQAQAPLAPSPQSFPVKPAAADQNEFDRLFNEPKAPPVRGNITNVYAAPQATPPPAPVQQGPSEYTLMFKGGNAAPAAPAPAPPPKATPAAPPAAKPAGPYMTLIYVLGGLLVVAIVLVIYLLAKK